MVSPSRKIAAAICLLPLAALAQQAPSTCEAFLGTWSGTWSQGFYGTQWIHVTEVSPQCTATIAYNPTGADVPASAHVLPVQGGVIEFMCNRGTGGTCRFEVVGGVLHARCAEPSGFVNLGTFHKQRASTSTQ